MLRAWRTCAAICLGAWLALTASRAAALELRWTAPKSCPDQAAMESRLDALLGERAKAAVLRARIQVTEQKARYKLKLQLDGEGVRGTRQLAGSDCAALADTATWLIATAIDPAIALPPAAPTPSPEPTPAPEAPAAPEVVEQEPALPPPPPVAPEQPATPSAWVLHAALNAGLWHLMDRPGSQSAVGLGLGGSWRWLLAEMRMDFGLPSESDIGFRGTVRANNQSLGVAACGLWEVGRSWLRAGPCLGFEGVRSHASARDLSVNAGAQNQFWADVRAGGQVAARLAWPVEAFTEVGLGTPVSARPQFRVTGATDPLEAQHVSVYARLGLRFRYPISQSARR